MFVFCGWQYVDSDLNYFKSGERQNLLNYAGRTGPVEPTNLLTTSFASGHQRTRRCHESSRITGIREVFFFSFFFFFQDFSSRFSPSFTIKYDRMVPGVNVGIRFCKNRDILNVYISFDINI